MGPLKLLFFDRGWRAVDYKNRHVEGIGPAKWVFTKRDKYVIADKKMTSDAFQHLNDRKDGKVKDGSSLPVLRISPSNRKHHGDTRSCNHSHCCANANGSEYTLKAVPRVRSASIQTVETVDASIQTSFTPSNYNASNKMQPNTSHESITSKQQKSRLSLTRPNCPNQEKIKVIAKKPIIIDNTVAVPAARPLPYSKLDILVQDKDIDIIRSFFMENSNNFDLYRFDAGGAYQFNCICLLTPIIQIERSREIHRMLRERKDSQDTINQEDFVSNLGLTSISEKPAPKRYKMRNKTDKQTNDDKTKLTENNDKTKSKVMFSDYTSEIDSTSDSETDFKPTKTKSAPKNKSHRGKQIKKSDGKGTLSSKTSGKVIDTYENSGFETTRDSRKNKNKVYSSSSDDEVVLNSQKNKTTDKDIHDEREKQNKLTLKRNKEGWYLKSNTSADNDLGQGKNDITTKNNRIQNKRDNKEDMNTILPKSVKNNDNKPKAKISLERDKKGRFLPDKSYSKRKNEKNNTANKNKIEESSFEVSESNSNAEDDPPRQIKTRRCTAINENTKRENATVNKNDAQNSEDDFETSKRELRNRNNNKKTIEINDRFDNRNDNNMSDSEDFPRGNKRPREKITEFIDLSGLVSDEENSSAHKNRSSEIYFSDESDVEVKKNKITSDIKSMSKKGQASSSSAYRLEYSSLEDHAIVSWVSNGGRARLVNGNRMWQELSEQYRNITGLNRSWHSLRNRYLRSILPRLEVMALDSVLISRLRAAASTGEIISRKKQPPRRNSIFALPTRGALSRRAARTLSEDEPPAKRHKLEGVEAPQSRKLRSSLVTSPGNSSRSPRYSEITRRFARNHKLDSDSSTPTSRRNSTESENACDKSPEASTSRKDAKSNARNKSPEATTSRKDAKSNARNKSPEASTSRKDAKSNARNKSPEASTSRKDAKSNARNKSPEATISGIRLTENSPETKKPRDLAIKRSPRISMDASLPSNTFQRRSLRNRSVSSKSPVATVKNGRQSFSSEKFEANKSESGTKSRRKSLRMDDSISPVGTTSKELPKSRRDEDSDGSITPVLTKSAQKSSGSATISRRKSVKDRSRSNSPVLTRSVQKSTESATKLRRKSVRDRSRSNSPVLMISAEKSPGCATRGRRNSLPFRSPLATSSLQSSRRTRKLYNPKAGIQ